LDEDEGRLQFKVFLALRAHQRRVQVGMTGGTDVHSVRKYVSDWTPDHLIFSLEYFF